MSNCKECPWVNKTENNLKFIGHAKRHNKTHNCHMIPSSKRGGVWDTKEEYICVGNNNWSLNQNKDKSICCNENTIRYSSVGVNNDVDTHYTCTNCGIIKTNIR